MDTQERLPDDRLSPDEIRLLELARRRGFRPLMLALDRLRPGAASALGGAATAHEESIRFRHDPSLALSTGDVTSVRELELSHDAGGASRRALEVTTAFLGLTGEVSPLPSYIAEEIAQEVAQEEEPPRRRDFLDLFHHRALSFLHRAIAKHDMPGSALSDQTDDWARRLLALLGHDRPPGAPAAAADAPPAAVLLRLAPLLTERAPTAAAVEASVAEQFADELRGGGVAVEQFVGSWVPLAPDERTRLGAAASALGQSFVLGARIYDRSGRFRVVIGPLDAEGYARFSVPARAEAVTRFARSLVGDELDVEVTLLLSPDAAPGFALSSSGRSRLGRNTWLGRQGAETRVTVGGTAEVGNHHA